MVEKILIHRLFVDAKGRAIEVCQGKEIRLIACYCDSEENHGRNGNDRRAWSQSHIQR